LGSRSSFARFQETAALGISFRTQLWGAALGSFLELLFEAAAQSWSSKLPLLPKAAVPQSRSLSKVVIGSSSKQLLPEPLKFAPKVVAESF